MMLMEAMAQGLIVGIITVGKLAMIILPLMVGIEFAKEFGWLEILSRRSVWFTRAFHLPPSAALPAFAGLFIGIVSGSGIILQIAKEERYARSTLTILFVMVGICHSLLEETILFVGLEVNLFLVAGSRLIAALVFSYIFSRIVTPAYSPEEQATDSLRI
ncbi:MAG TPA: hypothetical protein VN611_09690 [Patescibacteria group bacterium]|nr:hypothetical protein [Patescibacteria group bacterium]